MSEHFHTLLDKLDSIKTRLTDNEYKTLVETVAAARETTITKREYLVDMFVPYLRHTCDLRECSCSVDLYEFTEFRIDIEQMDDRDEIEAALDALEAKHLKFFNCLSIEELPELLKILCVAGQESLVITESPVLIISARKLD